MGSSVVRRGGQGHGRPRPPIETHAASKCARCRRCSWAPPPLASRSIGRSIDQTADVCTPAVAAPLVVNKTVRRRRWWRLFLNVPKGGAEGLPAGVGVGWRGGRFDRREEGAQPPEWICGSSRRSTTKARPAPIMATRTNSRGRPKRARAQKSVCYDSEHTHAPPLTALSTRAFDRVRWRKGGRARRLVVGSRGRSKAPAQPQQEKKEETGAWCQRARAVIAPPPRRSNRAEPLTTPSRRHALALPNGRFQRGRHR